MIIGISGKIGSGKDLTGKIIQYLITQKNKNSDIISEENFNAFCLCDTDAYSGWEIHRYGDALKEIVCILTGCKREDLEKQDFKKSYLSKDWNYIETWTGVEVTKQMTYREMLQKVGTECMRNNLHPNTWVNALFSKYKPINQSKEGRFTVDYGNCKVDYKHNQVYDGDINKYLIYPNWIITDVRFPNEFEAIKERGGINIRVNRFDDSGIQATFINSHPSETLLDDYKFDYVIDNSDTIEDLILKVKEILIKEKII